jgi:hypothetical protein
VGNPPSAELNVTVVNDLTAEPQATDPTVQLSTSELRHVVVAFGKLNWKPCDPADANVIAPGPFVVDLVTNKIEPPLPPVPVPPGGFCGMDAPLTTSAPNAELQGRSILFSGLRSDGTLFILYAAMAGTLHMVPEPGVKWNTATSSSIIWALRPHRWLAPAELDAETSDPLGAVLRVIVIDVNRHPILYTAIRNRIGGRSSFYADLDGTHTITEHDRTNGLIGEGLPSLD